MKYPLRFSLCAILLSFFSLEALHKVPFEQSMLHYSGYQAENPGWISLKSLYDNYQNGASIEDQYTIPKKIHLIWLGSPLPQRCRNMISSWEKFHPTWTIKVWTDVDAASFPFINRIAFDRAQNYGEKSDIWRYEILYQHGGLYIDTDFECLQPFDELHRSCEFYTGVGQTLNPDVWIGIIGSVPGHPILKATIDQIKIGPGDNNFERIMNDTGTYLFTKMFLEIALNCPIGTVVPFPLTFFYPFPGGERHRRDQSNIKEEFVKPESMAIHYFATSWQN
jgi:inositol phosphorylceramide mannosyltransferase catalytic subunit